MSRIDMAIVLLVAVGLAPPLAAAELEVVAATGVLEPAGLAVGQELAAGTVLRLEPWGRAVVRETSGCGLTQVIAGAPEHPLTLTDDCARVAGAGEVVALIQQGAAFAAPIETSEEAATLVQMLANEPCVFLARVSEQGSNARRCPSGYGLRGLRCSGEFCAGKDLLCCPYLGGEPDPTAKEMKSRLISEEFPNVVQSKWFLNGLACNGPNCDNVLPYQFKSARVANTQQCEWSPWSDELANQWLDCGDGRLISGLRCRSDYCGNVGVYCCAPEAK